MTRKNLIRHATNSNTTATIGSVAVLSALAATSTFAAVQTVQPSGSSGLINNGYSSSSTSDSARGKSCGFDRSGVSSTTGNQVTDCNTTSEDESLVLIEMAGGKKSAAAIKRGKGSKNLIVVANKDSSSSSSESTSTGTESTSDSAQSVPAKTKHHGDRRSRNPSHRGQPTVIIKNSKVQLINRAKCHGPIKTNTVRKCVSNFSSLSAVAANDTTNVKNLNVSHTGTQENFERSGSSSSAQAEVGSPSSSTPAEAKSQSKRSSDKTRPTVDQLSVRAVTPPVGPPLTHFDMIKILQSLRPLSPRSDRTQKSHSAPQPAMEPTTENPVRVIAEEPVVGEGLNLYHGNYRSAVPQSVKTDSKGYSSAAEVQSAKQQPEISRSFIERANVGTTLRRIIRLPDEKKVRFQEQRFEVAPAIPDAQSKSSIIKEDSSNISDSNEQQRTTQNIVVTPAPAPAANVDPTDLNIQLKQVLHYQMPIEDKSVHGGESLYIASSSEPEPEDPEHYVPWVRIHELK